MNRLLFKSPAILIIGILMAGIIFSCTGSKKSASSENEGNTAVIEDSVRINNPHIVKQDLLAPGTALVLFLSFNLIENNPQKVVWETSVKEVFGYGSSTPPIDVGESMQVNVTGYFMNHKTSPAEYAKRDSLICLISHKQGEGFSQNSSRTTWELVDILKN